jgi:prepilin-type N-terminal cleavage/methylation domain-containing protein
MRVCVPQDGTIFFLIIFERRLYKKPSFKSRNYIYYTSIDSPSHTVYTFLMFKKCPNRLHGFTLIEIIIVLIILGVLAALSIRAYFEHIERSRITVQVLEVMKTVKNNMDGCIMAHDGSPTRIQDCGLSIIWGGAATFPAISTSENGSVYGPGIWGSGGDNNTYYYLFWRDTGGGVSATVTNCGGQPVNFTTSSFVLCREPDGTSHIDGGRNFSGFHISSL